MLAGNEWRGADSAYRRGEGAVVEVWRMFRGWGGDSGI